MAADFCKPRRDAKTREENKKTINETLLFKSTESFCGGTETLYFGKYTTDLVRIVSVGNWHCLFPNLVIFFMVIHHEGCILRPQTHKNIIRVYPCSSVAKKFIFMAD